MIIQINELYSKYRNMVKVGKELKISPSTVKKYLNDDNLKISKQNYDDRDALYFYIYRLFGGEIDMPVSTKNLVLMQKFASNGINYKAQLLTLKWYYEIEKNPIQEKYKTIGLIPYIINRAAYYYTSKQKEIEKAEEQIKKQLEQDRITLNINPSEYINRNRNRRKKKKIINLNEIESEEK